MRPVAIAFKYQDLGDLFGRAAGARRVEGWLSCILVVDDLFPLCRVCHSSIRPYGGAARRRVRDGPADRDRLGDSPAFSGEDPAGPGPRWIPPIQQGPGGGFRLRLRGRRNFHDANRRGSGGPGRYRRLPRGQRGMQRSCGVWHARFLDGAPVAYHRLFRGDFYRGSGECTGGEAPTARPAAPGALEKRGRQKR